MSSDNPQMQLSSPKHQTIQQYINQNLQLKTLKIKKFSFQQSFSCDIKSSRKLRNSFTTRQYFHNQNDQQRYVSTSDGWEPKLSHRKLMKQPKVILSVERRKIKTSQSIRKANAVFSAPQTRVGFKGQKVRSQSFFIQKSQQKIPKKLIIDTSPLPFQPKPKKIPNFHFNFKYVIQQRKKGSQNLSIQQRTKQGSNKGYFAFFGSQNFTKYLEKNANNQNNRLFNKTHNMKRKQSNNKSRVLKNQSRQR